MKNMQLDDEEARWKRLCLQELSGIKKLKRRRPEPAKPQLGACRTFPGDLKVRPPVLGGGLGGEGGSRAESKTAASKGAAAATAAPAELVESRGGGGSNEVLDMRKPAFPAGLFTSLQQPLRKDTCLRPVSVNGAEGQALSGQSLPSRVMACQQQRRRPLESPPYSPVSPAIYGSHPDSSLSPRKRPGELAGASSEIKALQQTRRLLANARERTRVHTISAAFEALRKQESSRRNTVKDETESPGVTAF